MLLTAVTVMGIAVTVWVIVPALPLKLPDPPFG